jgi:biopolymer transport protein ExbB
MFAASLFSLDQIKQIIATGGWILLPLALCSVIMVTLIIWKALELRTIHLTPEPTVATLANVGPAVEAGTLGELLQHLRADESILGRISAAAFQARHPDLASATRAAEMTGREEVVRMERGVIYLEVIFTIAPMLGLIGTVGGLIRIFSNIGVGSRDAAQAQEIALGISEAMVTTIAGLVVAIPALIAHVVFQRRIEASAVRMASLTNRALEDAWHATPPA